MAKKKKYRSLDDLNAAQRRMNTKCVAIEDDLLNIVSNPLAAVTGSVGSSGKKNSRKHKNKHSQSAGIASLIPGAGILGPDLLKQLFFKAIPSKRRSGALLKTVAKIALKVVVVDAAVWGFSKIKQRIRSKRKKIST